MRVVILNLIRRVVRRRGIRRLRRIRGRRHLL
jgi:hypothetical protein